MNKGTTLVCKSLTFTTAQPVFPIWCGAWRGYRRASVPDVCRAKNIDPKVIVAIVFKVIEPKVFVVNAVACGDGWPGALWCNCRTKHGRVGG